MITSAFRPSLAVRVVLLAAAYAPLLVLLAVLDSFRLGWLRWLLGAMSATAVLATMLFLLVTVPRRNAEPDVLASAKPREAEALKFFASYVVPFFVPPSALDEARWGLLIYLALIGVLYLQSDIYYSNPLFALLGYRVFEASRIDGGHLVILSRSWHLSPGSTISLVPLGGYIAIEQPHRRRRPR